MGISYCVLCENVISKKQNRCIQIQIAVFHFNRLSVWPVCCLELFKPKESKCLFTHNNIIRDEGLV